MMWQNLRPNRAWARLASWRSPVVCAVALSVALAVRSAPAADAIPSPRAASFDELMFHVSRYGNTVERRANKSVAREELKRRGTLSLAYYMEHMDQDNMWFYVNARELTESLPDGDAAKVLIAHATNPTNEIRRIAVYLLGFCDTPVYAPRLRPMLADTNVAAAATRTLGKWKDREAVPPIAELLKDPKENRRVLAAVALGDIGSPAAIPSLIAALGDPVFTVRNAAATALARIPGKEPGKQLLAALPAVGDVAGRQIVRLLGEIGVADAKPALEALLEDADAGRRGDAVFALRQLGEDLDSWSRAKPALAADPFVQTRLHDPLPEP